MAHPVNLDLVVKISDSSMSIKNSMNPALKQLIKNIKKTLTVLLDF